eukprot:NODE_647_length_2226_cov_82.421778_g617_i0.p1 GENE.NODE_647_length_2226_cov_82.421778_g617_i0~~NODE_647_length_2226_cov_82.421778_g617_i0.p1  ORF type:complete len:456 (-),score=76.89 NODE_647_length_2226_cov_82.421778_g617_i0:153-1520(-)
MVDPTGTFVGHAQNHAFLEVDSEAGLVKQTSKDLEDLMADNNIIGNRQVLKAMDNHPEAGLPIHLLGCMLPHKVPAAVVEKAVQNHPTLKLSRDRSAVVRKVPFQPPPAAAVHDEGLKVVVRPITRRMAFPPTGNVFFSMCTYNILAKCYSKPSYYPNVPPRVLSWKYRLPMILSEIMSLQTDIVCLQEVQEDDWTNDFAPAFEKAGFSGVHTSTDALKNKLGIAIVWRQSTFTPITSEVVHFRDIAKVCSDKVVQDYYGGYHQVGLMVKLKTADQQILQASTAHISSNFKEQSVQLMQVQMMLDRQETFSKAQPPANRLVFCGDFNSTPGSAVHGLISKGTVAPTDPILYPPIITENPAASLPYPQPSHGLQLRSAYSQVFGQEPTFTNLSDCLTGKFEGTLDYVWVNPGIKVRGVLEVPDKAQLIPEGAINKGIPNAICPSDHLPLVAHLEYS